MRFDYLEERIKKHGPFKIYLVDHIHPGLFTGFVYEAEKGDESSHISLKPYISLINLRPTEPLVGKIDRDVDVLSKKYGGLIFQGRFVTTQFSEHEHQANAFIKKMWNNGQNLESLQEYFRIAKALKEN